MSAFIQSEVTAEQVADAMFEQPQFSLEVWEELADRLHKGAMADDLGDMLAALPRVRAMRFLTIIEQTFDGIKSLHFEPNT